MTYCVEPYIRDILLLWLENNTAYVQVSGEVAIGSDVHSGQIDLVAKTSAGEYHGFEIKNNTFAGEQINRYSNSKYLDKVFHCSRIGSLIVDKLTNNEKIEGGTYTNQQVRKGVSNAIAAGQYTEEEYIQAIDENFPDDLLKQPVSVCQTNERILDDDQKTVRARLVRNIGIPTADFNPSETYIELNIAIKRMQNNLLLPEQEGVINVPLDLGSTDEQDGFRKPLSSTIEDAFSKDKWTEVEVVRDGSALTREHTPTLSQVNEAWVQHHVWRKYGHISEAVVPNQQENAEYIIDVMKFEDGLPPAELYQSDTKGKLVGIEAKGESSLSLAGQTHSIQNQLIQYQSSKTISHLYLAVPKKYQKLGEQILQADSVSRVGLITVSLDGDVTIIREAARSEVQFDGYIKGSKSNGYPRSIGFGRIRPENEPKHISPCYID